MKLYKYTTIFNKLNTDKSKRGYFLFLSQINNLSQENRGVLQA